jgi:hypothetical protein
VKLLVNGDVLLTSREFADLLEYSTTLPTGTAAGKSWKCRRPWHASPSRAEWFRGVYGIPYPEGHLHQGKIPIGWRRIRVEGWTAQWPLDVRVPIRPISATGPAS